MSLTSKAIVGLLLLGVIDAIIPLPIIGFILVYVVLAKPPWLKKAIEDIYEEKK